MDYSVEPRAVAVEHVAAPVKPLVAPVDKGSPLVEAPGALPFLLAQAATWQLGPTSPVNTNLSADESRFWAKNGVAGPFMNQSERFQQVKGPKFWR